MAKSHFLYDCFQMGKNASCLVKTDPPLQIALVFCFVFKSPKKCVCQRHFNLFPTYNFVTGGSQDVNVAHLIGNIII